MTLSFEGATRTAKDASEERVSLWVTQILAPESIVQIPPWAAPRMNRPFWRIDSAPTRPLTAASEPSLRWLWMIGLGPIPAQADLNVTVAEGIGCVRIFADVSAPADRSWPACSTVRGWSPASRLRT